jgi:glycosyltransferase involved in cell wall biosynthesis
MDLTVIIPARNAELDLPHQLDALLAEEWDGQWEVIVVDNGSTDGTRGVVETYASQTDRIRLVRADQKPDKSYAVMTAVAAARAAACAICDADDIVATGWVGAMGRGLSAHPVVTGPNELDRLNPEWLASSRGRSADEAASTFYGIFTHMRGNNFGVRREVWQQVGPLASGFFPVEDMEFSLRCWLHGVEIVGLPDAVVHYRYRSSPRDLWRQGYAYGSHRPMIVRLLVQAGKPRPPRLGGWKSWLVLVVTIPILVTRRGRARWMWIAGNRFGQVVGTVRNRTLML